MKKEFPSFLLLDHPLNINFHDQVKQDVDVKTQREHLFEIFFLHLQSFLICSRQLVLFWGNRKKRMGMTYLQQKNSVAGPLNIDLLHRELQFVNRVLKKKFVEMNRFLVLT